MRDFRFHFCCFSCWCCYFCCWCTSRPTAVRHSRPQQPKPPSSSRFEAFQKQNEIQWKDNNKNNNDALLSFTWGKSRSAPGVATAAAPTLWHNLTPQSTSQSLSLLLRWKVIHKCLVGFLADAVFAADAAFSLLQYEEKWFFLGQLKKT